MDAKRDFEIDYDRSVRMFFELEERLNKEIENNRRMRKVLRSALHMLLFQSFYLTLIALKAFGFI